MKIPFDKVLHFAAGLLISFFCGIILYPIYGLGLACAAGVGKEVYDWVSVKYLNKSHSVDVFDALATFAGGLVSFGILMAIGLKYN